MTVRDAIPRSWLDFLKEGPVGVGMDIATSDGPNSNPASITVTQATDGRLYERLVISWKTRDEAVARAMLTTALEDLSSVFGLRIQACCLDASNEVFFAQSLAKGLREHCPFHLIKGGENITFQGQTLRSKELLGNLYVNAHTDGLICTPEGPFIKEDRRLVQKSKGLFVTLTGKGGKHGDTFDSGKLARWALMSSGAVEAAAAAVSGSGQRLDPFHRTSEDEDADFYTFDPLSC
ncbi:hypothetical protein [Prosthecobacter dejongeii]|uniref:Uncharacterized protein n=1 Tax=Prosthecobacter dejongeii TaxID=48465 RepID=A0A7W7YJ04_9BACT|nr:hypothetical protein [Prosthecobacter dejongeii]MBB5037096.1 hypothetical protein [Prosthecobacter dejongeii]